MENVGRMCGSALALLALLCCHRERDRKWEDLAGSAWGVPHTTRIPQGSATGEGISRGTHCISPAIALDSRGLPHVAWCHRVGASHDVFLRRWNGHSWVPMGETGSEVVSAHPWESARISLAVDPHDRPVVAFVESDQVSRSYVRVKRWEGCWVELPAGPYGLNVGDTFAWNPSLAVDPQSGHYFVAWQEYAGASTNPQIYLREWDGAQWKSLGGSASGLGLSHHSPWAAEPGVAVKNGRPTVAYSAQVGLRIEIHLREWNGSAWTEIGGSATGGGISGDQQNSYTPRVAFDGAGNPTVAWYEWQPPATWRVFAKRWNGCAWVTLGVPSEPTSSQVAMGLDAAGEPVLAWTQLFAGRGKIHLRRWNGAEWVGMGGSDVGYGVSGTPNNAEFPAIAIDREGRPVLAWHADLTGQSVYNIFVKRWNGTQWVPYGEEPPPGRPTNSQRPALAQDPEGRPTMAWSERTMGNNYEIHLRQWNGEQWIELAGSATGGGISGNAGGSSVPDVALDSQGRPVVAWEDDTSGDREIYLKRWNGSEWIELGGSATGGGVSDDTGSYSVGARVKVDRSDRPVVAWYHNSSGQYEVRVRRWEGAQWVDLPGLEGTVAMSPDLELDAAGNPILAWTSSDGAIRVSAWNGAGWTGLGRASGAAAAHQASVACDGRGRIYVAWTELAGDTEIRLRMWDGEWRDVGGPISDNPGASTRPQVAIGASGRPVVAWEDSSSGNYEIYVRFWTGKRWEGYENSDVDGGVSNSEAPSRFPRIAVSGGRVGVAWDDYGARGHGVFFRQYPERSR